MIWFLSPHCGGDALIEMGTDDDGFMIGCRFNAEEGEDYVISAASYGRRCDCK